MRTHPPRTATLRAALGALLGALTLTPLAAQANGPRGPQLRPAPAARTTSGRAAPAPAGVRPAPRRVVPPRPRVALQLTAVQTHIPVARSAVLHALARDSWPALVACVESSPGARGVSAVELSETRRRVSARTRGAPLDRNAPLRTCVERAFAALTLPPHEGDVPGVSVNFDLAFDMPSLR